MTGRPAAETTAGRGAGSSLLNAKCRFENCFKVRLELAGGRGRARATCQNIAIFLLLPAAPADLVALGWFGWSVDRRAQSAQNDSKCSRREEDR